MYTNNSFDYFLEYFACSCVVENNQIELYTYQQLLQSIYQSSTQLESMMFMLEQTDLIYNEFVNEAFRHVSTDLSKIFDKFCGTIFGFDMKLTVVFEKLYQKFVLIDRIVKFASKDAVTYEQVEKAMKNGWKLPSIYCKIPQRNLSNTTFDELAKLLIEYIHIEKPNDNTQKILGKIAKLYDNIGKVSNYEELDKAIKIQQMEFKKLRSEMGEIKYTDGNTFIIGGANNYRTFSTSTNGQSLSTNGQSLSKDEFEQIKWIALNGSSIISGYRMQTKKLIKSMARNVDLAKKIVRWENVNADKYIRKQIKKTSRMACIVIESELLITSYYVIKVAYPLLRLQQFHAIRTFSYIQRTVTPKYMFKNKIWVGFNPTHINFIIVYKYYFKAFSSFLILLFTELCT